MNKLIIVLLLIAAIWGGALLYLEQPKLVTETVGHTQFYKHIDKDSLNVLVMFSSSSCPTSKKIRGMLDSLAEPYKGKLRIIVVDCSKNGSLCGKFNIRHVPRFAIFRNGEPDGDLISVRNEYDLAELIEAAAGE